MICCDEENVSERADMNERVLVTGADGFVGRYVCRKLVEAGYSLRAGVRNVDSIPGLQRAVPGLSDSASLGDLGANPELRGPLGGVTAVVHLAARVHVMEESSGDPLQEFRRVNVAGTKSLARAAAEAGVRRFIFVSTIKVNGDLTSGEPFSVDMHPAPQGAYAISKWEAEEAIRSVAAESGLEVVIVRPPLVYGPGVRGNFLRLMSLVDRALPLPWPKGENRRSMIGARNLADFLVQCVDHPKAAGQTFLVKDSEDISTRELIARLARLLARPVRLVPVPASLIRLAASLTMKKEAAGRVLNSLVIDSDRAQQLLSWAPPVTLDEGLAATARWYREIYLPSRAKAC
jgi:nucleoside-diphosphate-sugar epimerase